MSEAEDRAWADYSERFRTEALPKILDSAIFMSLHSDSPEWDVRQATELGAALLIGKPLLIVLPRGRSLPAALRRAAEVVVDDWDPEDTDAQNRLVAAMHQLVGEG